MTFSKKKEFDTILDTVKVIDSVDVNGNLKMV